MAGGRISPEGPVVTAPDGRQVRQWTADQVGQIAVMRAEDSGILRRYNIDLKDADNVKSRLEGWAEKFAADSALTNPADKARANEFMAKLQDPNVKGEALVNATTDFLNGIKANHGGDAPTGMLLNERLGRPLDNISLVTQAYGATNNLKGGDIMLYHDFQMYSEKLNVHQLPGSESVAVAAQTAPATAPTPMKP